MTTDIDLKRKFLQILINLDQVIQDARLGCGLSSKATMEALDRGTKIINTARDDVLFHGDENYRIHDSIIEKETT